VAVSGAAILGVGFSFPWSAIAATVLRRTPERERGSAVGVLSAFFDLFVGVSSFAAGLVSNRFGYSGAFVMGAAALGAAAIAGRYIFPADEMETSPDEEECYETTP
jgi:MFS family permease